MEKDTISPIHLHYSYLHVKNLNKDKTENIQ